MITTDLNRAEFDGNNSSTDFVFASGGTNIPVKEASHIKVYLLNYGTFTADSSNETFTNVTLNGSANTSHGHLNQEILRLSAGTSLPEGLLENTDYYVRDKTTTTWKLETAVGAGVKAITSNGAGTLTWNKTTLQTISTHYTVTLSDTTATVKFVTAPPTNVKIIFIREVPYQQNTDLLNNSLIEAESLESQLDLIVNQVQQLKNTTARDFKLSDTLLASDATETQATLNVTKTNRANKALKFDANGNIAVSTLDVDKIEDSVSDAKSYATEAGANVNTYDAGSASATSDYSAKEWAVGTTTTSAKDYATKTSGAVTGTDFSAKAWSVGGTNVTTTASRGAAKEWATTTGSAVDTSEYSSKEYAQGSVLAAGGSSKNWAQSATTPSTTATDASAKEWATGVSTHKNEGSSKDWAIYTAGDVRGASAGSMSSKEWAVGTQGRGVASEGSAKDWATYTGGTVDNAGYSAKYHATDASNSATAAKNSAASVSNIFDSFDDTYLGRMADSDSQGTNPTTNGTWAKNSSTITVASGSNIKVGQVVTGTGMPTSPKPNVISVDGTTVIISENMVAAGSAVALTFTGYGVYGDYNGSKDGPALNNDGDALATGSLYFNSTDNEMRIYDGANWIAATSAGDTSLLEYKFVTTSAQVTSKTYSGSADVGGTLSYTQDNIIVFMNGIQLKNGVDYTASNGTSIVLTNSASLSDEIAVIAFKSFTTADMVSKSNGGTFASAVTFGAGLTSTTEITANGGLQTDTNSIIKDKGRFMQHSTHQSWVLGG